ncbi:hypothetical protein MBSD_n2411 [Mizugakiibacter sediminis]|uniref:Uncharacterized protein n=2 Tax=Mizugakiibacter sediminis TaxID=1475481 RepID=A0A0K8QQA5_9GAMM|nr:hypothetical protein [Mizugakiibacter sediminis]GAP67095.1 hypothetical protein MBSD_n2411 [Mizugakiibacter sediminis]
MNELAWLKQARALNAPVEPGRDLWPDIAARIAAPAPRRRRSPRLLLAAASAAVALVVGGISARLLLEAAADAPAVGREARWNPHDPRLAGAAIELDAARYELRQALDESPKAAFLHRLIDRTERQQARLRQLEHRAG